MVILYKFLFGILWMVSKLPFWFLYLKSDFLYLFIYRIFGYRKKVVFENLHNAFPSKSEREIRQIAKKFYRNLCDLVVEVIKMRSITPRQLEKRVKFKNAEIIQECYDKGKSIIVCIGHCGNWEWMAIKLWFITSFEVLAIFKPLSDPYFDRYMLKLREKFKKNSVVPFKKAFRTIAGMRDTQTLSIMASDQTPTRDEINYWTTFLNQDTPVFLGVEKISKALDMPVLFFDIQRIKRGHYEVTVSKLTDDPKATDSYEITEAHVKKLEQSILEHPDNWLWSHRRWKHKKFD